jgi:hypothetical protein
MTVKALQEQLNSLLKNKFIKEDDEVFLLGSGDRENGFFMDGLAMPPFEQKDIIIKDHPAGFYLIGIMKR